MPDDTQRSRGVRDDETTWARPDELPTADEAARVRDGSARPTRTEDALGLPERIGPYRILDLVGEGGMGAVFRARQRQPIQREVAIKVLKAGMDTAAVLRRFELEQQTLSRMDHPCIARVHDAGMTDRGRPYLVMEYVRGIPITAYADQAGLDVRARLELFRDLLDAVQHAHQKAVLHRDLKPSNILVTLHDGRPQPKVIDFGIAKVLDTMADETLVTRLGEWIGTPEYMSPEQASGSPLDVDTRSDVYSLGMILYQLLSGCLPHDGEELRESGLDELRRQLVEGRLERPSSRLDRCIDRDEIAEERAAETKELVATLAGDLDWIVMKALEKERSRRYPSASAFADDIQRYLDDRPVEARPPSVVDQMRKFARRHRLGVSVGAALLAVVVMSSVALLVQSRRIARESLRADAARAEAEELIGFMVGDLYRGLEPLGRLDLLEEVARNSVDYYERNPPQVSGPPAVRWESDRRRALTFRNAGRVFEARGDSAAALGAFDRYFQVTDALLRESPAEEMAGRVRLDRLEALKEKSEVLEVQGAVDEAIALARTTITEIEREIERTPDGDRAPLLLWDQLVSLGFFHLDAGELDLARPSFERASQLAERQARSRRLPAWQVNRARSLSYLGLTDQEGGTLAAARQRYAEALDILRRAGAALGDTQTRRELLLTYQRLGYVELRIARSDPDLRLSAVENLEQAVVQAQRLFEDEPQDAKVARELSASHTYLSEALVALGRQREALVQSQRALELSQALAQRDRTNLNSQNDLAYDLVLVGTLQRGLGEESAARASFERAADLMRPIVAENRGSYYLDAYARALASLGRARAAREIAEELERRGQLPPELAALVAAASE